MDTWLVNGQPGDKISITDRGFTYGDGLFETIAVRQGHARFVDYHLDRLFEGCTRLGIGVVDRQSLTDEILSLASDCPYGTLKLIITRGAGPRGYSPPREIEPTRITGLLPGEPDRQIAFQSGVTVRLCKTTVSTNPILAGLKSLGRLEQVLAKAEWNDPQIAEGLMRAEDGRVVCGTMTNLFMVQSGRLSTPDLFRDGVKGVMRRVVIETANSMGIDCIERDIDTDDLNQAEELFLTNSLIGIWPVTGLEANRYEIGILTRRLMQGLARQGVSECAL